MKKLLTILALKLCLATILADSPFSLVDDLIKVPTSIISGLDGESNSGSDSTTNTSSSNGSSSDDGTSSNKKTASEDLSTNKSRDSSEMMIVLHDSSTLSSNISDMLLIVENSTGNFDYDGMTDDPDDDSTNDSTGYSTDDSTSTDDPSSTDDPRSTDDPDDDSTDDLVDITTDDSSVTDDPGEMSADESNDNLTASADQKSFNGSDPKSTDESGQDSSSQSDNGGNDPTDDSGKRSKRAIGPFSLQTNVQIDPDFSRLSKAIRHSHLTPALSSPFAKKLAELRQSRFRPASPQIPNQPDNSLPPTDQDLDPDEVSSPSNMGSLNNDDLRDEPSSLPIEPKQTKGVTDDLPKPIQNDEDISSSEENGIDNNPKMNQLPSMLPSEKDESTDELETLDSPRDSNQIASLPVSDDEESDEEIQPEISNTARSAIHGDEDPEKVLKELKQELSQINSKANELGDIIEHEQEKSSTESSTKPDDTLKTDSLEDDATNDDSSDSEISDEEPSVNEETRGLEPSPTSLSNDSNKLDNIPEKPELGSIQPMESESSTSGTEESASESKLMPLNPINDDDSADSSSDEESSDSETDNALSEENGPENLPKPSENQNMLQLLNAIEPDTHTESLLTSKLTPTLADITETRDSLKESTPASEPTLVNENMDIDQILDSLLKNEGTKADPGLIDNSPPTVPPSDSDESDSDSSEWSAETESDVKGIPESSESPDSILLSSTGSDDQETPQELTPTSKMILEDEDLGTERSDITTTLPESTSGDEDPFDIFKSIRDWGSSFFSSTTERAEDESTLAPSLADENLESVFDSSEELPNDIGAEMNPEILQQLEPSSTLMPTPGEGDGVNSPQTLDEPGPNPESILDTLKRIAEQPNLKSDDLDSDSELPNVPLSPIEEQTEDILKLLRESTSAPSLDAAIKNELDQMLSEISVTASSSPDIQKIIDDEILTSSEPTMTTPSTPSIQQIIDDEISLLDSKMPSTPISDKTSDLETPALTSTTPPTQTSASSLIDEPRTSSISDLIELAKDIKDDLNEASSSPLENSSNDTDSDQDLVEPEEDGQFTDDRDFSKEYQELCSSSKSTIKLSGMKLRRIGYPFLSNENIRCMEVSDCDIVTVDRLAFEGLPNLQYIDMSYNRFDLNNIFLNDLPNAEVLILDNSGYKGTEICSTQCGLFQEIHLERAHPKLKKLSISNTYHRLKISSTSKSNLPSLTDLNLSETRVEDDTFDWLPNTIRNLDLSGHALRSLTLQNLKSLRSINLDYPAEKYLDKLTLTKLNRLEKLSLRSNNMKEILIPLFATTKSLSFLDLFDNSVRFIESGSFDNLKHLKNVNLAQNDLVIIEEGIFDNLAQLETLDLSKNFISIFSPISNVPELKKLSLNCNNLRSVKGGTFSSMISLESLYLHNNRIEKIDQKAFSGLSRLRTLTLSNNLLSSLPYGWTLSLERLETLDLSGNRFSSINSLALYPLSPVKKLYLSNLESIEPNEIDSIPKNVTIHLETQKTFVKPCKIDGKET